MILQRPTGSMVENRKRRAALGTCLFHLIRPHLSPAVWGKYITQSSSFWSPLKGRELNSGEWMPFISFEKILCSWKCSYKHLPISLHCWQWQVVVIQKQGTRKQKLKNVSPFLCLSSGNPSFLTCLTPPADQPKSQATWWLHPASW